MSEDRRDGEHQQKRGRKRSSGSDAVRGAGGRGAEVRGAEVSGARAGSPGRSPAGKDAVASGEQVGNLERKRQMYSGNMGAKDVTSGPFTLKDIASILEMLDKHDVTEFRLQRGEERLALRRGKEQRRRAPQSIPQLLTGVPGGIPAGAQQVPAGSSLVSNVVPFVPAADQSARPGTPVKDVAPAEIAPKRALKEITSPMVGTFYRRPAVDAEPYVEVGDSVKKGDVLCIVEAMKLMNEIETDTSGKIVEVCLDDGQMVEFGEVLFRIELV